MNSRSSRLQIFSGFIILLLMGDCVSAGLLQTIRDAAFLRDSLDEEAEAEGNSNAGREQRALPGFQPLPDKEGDGGGGSFFDQYYPTSASPKADGQPCPPGDFLCIAQRNLKNTLGSEMSNAIVKTVASMMTEMLNTTIARSLDLMSQARSATDPVKQVEETGEAIQMVTNGLQLVTTKAIQGLALFVKTSLNGAMWDLYGQLMNAAKSGAALMTSRKGSSVTNQQNEATRGLNNNNEETTRIVINKKNKNIPPPPAPPKDQIIPQQQPQPETFEGDDTNGNGEPILIAPSDMIQPHLLGNNEIKRMDKNVQEDGKKVITSPKREVGL